MSALGFTAPWILPALLLLPAIWLLLKVTPPLPRRALFPPIALLKDLPDQEQTPSGTPWWLMAIRVLAAALVILALAGPQIGRSLTLSGSGPVLLLIDNGWSAAQNWAAHKSLALEAVRLAAAADRPVMMIATADPLDLSLLDKGAAMRKLERLQPRPWRKARIDVVAALNKLKRLDADILWLSDGIDHGGAAETARALRRHGALRLYRDRPEKAVLAITSVAAGIGGLTATVRRADGEGARQGRIEVQGGDGDALGAAPYRFRDGETLARVGIDMPLEMRNKATKLTLSGERGAGTTFLFDRGAPRRAIAIAGGASDDNLLSGSYYLERALKPYADVAFGTIAAGLARQPSVLIVTDIGKIAGSDHDQIDRFVRDGGLLIRFAGEAMAAGSDDLVPVRLRSGGRSFSGALTWAKAQSLAPFAAASPFGGLKVPAEVLVRRQILAEPSIALSQHAWARLKDGTPMVTAAKRGKGWIVLFHVAAGPDWSNLPLSGLFVDMLRRLLPLAAGLGPGELAPGAALSPVMTLDGFGRLRRAGAELLPIKAADLATLIPSGEHPPGLYGQHGNLRAVNAVDESESLKPIRIEGDMKYYADRAAGDLAPPLWLAAMLLIIVDFALSLFLRGLAPYPRRWLRFVVPALALMTVLPPAAKADDAFAMKAALDTRLAYIVTGAPDTDAISRAGLIGLGRELRQRTAYEPQEPMAVNPETDALDFFPLLYWPMEPRQKDLSPQAVVKLADYLRQGGTLLIDTRARTLSGFEGADSVGHRTLRRLAGGLDLPPLQKVPKDHALTKAFYLIDAFPGRWAGGAVWVETTAPGRGAEEVSPIIMGDADWAAAWAMDNQGRPMFDPVPGGEQQREMAIRFGINAVMYALTGNYKNDQIHVPAILERLGH